MLDTTRYHVALEFTTDLIGTVSKNKQIYTDFIASKAPKPEDGDEELATVPESETKGETGFHQDEDGNFLYNYAVKGFLRESARALKQWGVLKQLHDKFTRYVQVEPRKVRLPAVSESFERPLRAMSMRGPRVCLAKSDVIKAPFRIEFDLEVLDVSGIKEGTIKDVLEFGERFVGLGQWRSGGWGQFRTLELREI